jgi:hypothetical protein
MLLRVYSEIFNWSNFEIRRVLFAAFQFLNAGAGLDSEELVRLSNLKRCRGAR